MNCAQKVNMTAHLKKMESDIVKIIPDVNFDGLAIIDWEAWRPRYEANWESRKVFQTESRNLVMAAQPHMAVGDVTAAAIKQFNEAAKSVSRRDA
jgi:hyaluronoglucosaminidase